jgi:DNA repair protein SbcC/Rad50
MNFVLGLKSTMIESLQIRNFQKHKSLNIDLDQITCIIGASDQGKSAVIRALRWAMLNQPRGTTFITNGKSKCGVQVVLDGHKLERRRTASDNVYKLNGDEFRAFSNKVPETIENILNVSELHFQGQHDAPYWMGLGGFEVSRQLNSIVDLSVIDQTIKNANAGVTNAEAHYSSQKEAAELAIEAENALKWVPEASKDWGGLQAIYEDLANLKSNVANLEGVLKRAVLIDTESQVSSLYAAEAAGVLAAAERALEADGKRNNLHLAISEARESVPEEYPNFAPVKESFEKYQEIFNQVKLLGEVVDDFGDMETLIANTRKKLSYYKSKLAEVSACPLCERSF